MTESNSVANATVPTARKRIPAPRIEVRIVREAGASTERVLVLDGERVHVGASSKNDVVLEDPEVSRFHCVLERGARAWRLVDSGSLNGTYLGEISLRDVELPAKCALRVGRSELEIRELPSTGVVEVVEQASFGDLFGQSRAMQQLFALLERVAESDANVLIEGESGTGKELVATEIVRRGGRAKKPFVVVDCSAIAPSLIESELFGHVRGAFTGAERERAGAFEAAHGGTVFLDEVGELPQELQPKLLRALEAREVRRVGENSVRRVDVRILAATNRRLEREVNRGAFREDLYYRLSVVTVRVPPLRERLDDLDLLVRAFLRTLAADEGAALFGPEVIDRMKQHDWPGNVRELRNYVERCIVMQAPQPTGARRASTEAPEAAADDKVDLDVPFRVAKDAAIAAFERRYVETLIAWAGGNISRAARRANMDRMNLYRILQRSGLRSLDD